MPNHSGDLWIGGTVTLVTGAAVTLLLGQSFPKAAIAGVATAGSGIGIAVLQTSRMRSAQEKENVTLQEKINALQEKLKEKSAAIHFEGQLEELQQKVDWQRGEESRFEDEIRQAELQLSQSRGEFAELQRRGELVRAEQQEIKGQVETQKRSLDTALLHE
jgi:chromosome segregation ATPase